MDAKLFASHYPQSHIQPSENDGSTFANAQRWANTFGKHLHSILRDEHTEPLDIDPYLNWIDTDYLALEHRLFTKNGGPKAMDTTARRLSELSFHILNSSMVSLWLTSHLPAENERFIKIRKEAMAIAQGTLAIRALNLYDYKNKLAQEGKYFTPEFEPMRNTIQGRLTEMDAAISLLNYLKRKRIEANLYATPAQFEHGNSIENNIDLLLHDPIQQQAVGIQVKSSVNKYYKDRYDQQKIVLIDGSVDLGNSKIVLDTVTREKKVIPWAGMIALAHLRDMPPHDVRLFSDNPYTDPKTISIKRLLARHYLRSTKSYVPYATANVGDRIDSYFEKQLVA